MRILLSIIGFALVSILILFMYAALVVASKSDK